MGSCLNCGEDCDDGEDFCCDTCEDEYDNGEYDE